MPRSDVGARAEASPLGREVLLLLGGARAILLQIADPAIGHGVAAHSDFVGRPMDRLRATLEFVYVVINGTPEQAARVARRVNRAHGPVRRTEGEPTYSAFDPALQLWVAATIYDTAVTVTETVFGRLADSDADALYRDYALLGSALQMPDDLWPADRAAFAEYWHERLAELRVDDTVRGVARSLLVEARLPLALRPLRPLLRIMTTGLLPPSVRPLFGLRWTARADAVFTAWIRVIRFVYPLLPAFVREAPLRAALRRAGSESRA
ncbi:oxygenase MpaB family protein [Agromyces atrinae]|uniref:DUF2236 domain-containing protein n=1 Tax=Agromyces atrinae TaxID=592376 RepID=A0A4Q2M3F3_9MICO|nr:oxygenase MpaB family protein [Agromyces atrinae]NYD66177.1 uncharacterized protein (DUF2236 family) [Agromyces atrinae]RXZ86515.1 DUF2236 domain-containing protein [Agromyces atrinae]